jgi:8-amino-7-oxononanoate synthase
MALKALEKLEKGEAEEVRLLPDISTPPMTNTLANSFYTPTQPAAHVHHLALLFVSCLLSSLPSPSPIQLPPHLLALPPCTSSPPPAHPPTSPIIPLLMPSPRPLAAFLRERGYLTRPITYPTVPHGEERVRLCLHAGNTEEEVKGLAKAVVEWARNQGRRGLTAKL